MSISTAASYRAKPSCRIEALRTTAEIAWHEWIALSVGIIEICLQLDTYLMYHQSDAEFGSIAGLNVSVASLCVAYLYAVWLGRTMTVPIRQKANFLWNVPMVVYIAAIAFSILAASVPLLAFFDLAMVLQAFAIFFYIANRMRNQQDIVNCVLILAASLAIQSSFVIGLSALGTAGEKYLFGPIHLSIWPDGRPGGSVHSPVSAASLMALIWVPVMTLSLTTRQTRVRFICITCTGLGMLAILLTQTRGAILTIGIATAVIGCLMARRMLLPRWSLAAAVTLALIGAYPLFLVIVNRVTGDDEGSAAARGHLAKIGIQAIRNAPFQGYGAGNCHIACRNISDESEFRGLWYYTIHCKYLIVWIETGLIGFISFLLMMGNGIRHGVSAWQRPAAPLLGTLGLGFCAAVLGHMTHMLVDIFNSRSQVQLLWVVLGIAAANYRVNHAYLSKPRVSEPRGGGVQLGI